MVSTPPEDAPKATEMQRTEALKATGLLDGKRRPCFDRITALLAQTFNCETALLSFMTVDRQWVLSSAQPGEASGPRDISMCKTVVTEGRPVWVEDARRDPRFRDNPSVKQKGGIRSYLAVPVSLSNGMRIGSVCIADPRPGLFSRADIDRVELIAKIAEDVITAQLGEAAARSSRHELNLKSNQILAKNRLLENAEAVAKIGSWEVTADLQALKWSRQTYAMHDLPNGTAIRVAEAIGFYAEEDRALVSECLYKAMTDRSGFEFEATILSASGARKRVKAVGEFITGSKWVDDTIVGVIQEIDPA